MIFTAPPHCGALAMALALVSVSCSTTSDRYRALASELERAAPQGRMEREHHAALEGNSDGDDPFPGAATLERGALIMQVLARHPTLDAARNAWRAALAEVEQTQAFDDPMVAYRVAPLSISLPRISPDAPFGHEIMLSQTLPFPGRRERAGDRALADVELARLQHHAAQLDLALAAAHLHADYVTNASMRAFTNEFATLGEQMRGSAAAQFEAGRGSLQDPLYAELELAHLEHDKIRLDAEGTVIVAHINSLLHRRPKAALPPAPLWAAAPGSGHHHADDEHEHEDEDLEGLALASRPDLAAARARIASAALSRRAPRSLAISSSSALTSGRSASSSNAPLPFLYSSSIATRASGSEWTDAGPTSAATAASRSAWSLTSLAPHWALASAYVRSPGPACVLVLFACSAGTASSCSCCSSA